MTPFSRFTSASAADFCAPQSASSCFSKIMSVSSVCFLMSSIFTLASSLGASFSFPMRTLASSCCRESSERRAAIFASHSFRRRPDSSLDFCAISSASWACLRECASSWYNSAIRVSYFVFSADKASSFYPIMLEQRRRCLARMCTLLFVDHRPQ